MSVRRDIGDAAIYFDCYLQVAFLSASILAPFPKDPLAVDSAPVSQVRRLAAHCTSYIEEQANQEFLDKSIFLLL